MVVRHGIVSEGADIGRHFAYGLPFQDFAPVLDASRCSHSEPRRDVAGSFYCSSLSIPAVVDKTAGLWNGVCGVLFGRPLSGPSIVCLENGSHGH